MLTITHYMDLARERQDLPSDRQLGFAIGMNGNAITHWRTGRAWPTDDNMLTLARMAGIEPELALLDLNRWRCGRAAGAVYARMASRLSKIPAAVLLAFFMSFVQGHPQAVGVSTETTPNLSQNLPADFILWKIIIQKDS